MAHLREDLSSLRHVISRASMDLESQNEETKAKIDQAIEGLADDLISEMKNTNESHHAFHYRIMNATMERFEMERQIKQHISSHLSKRIS